MNKRAIIIRKSASFMTNAVQKNLEQAGYEILPVNATVAAVNEKHTEADILIFYLGEFISDASNLLVYLKTSAPTRKSSWFCSAMLRKLRRWRRRFLPL